MKRHDSAIAFDLDGTLVRGGSDKEVHIPIAVWIACSDNGYGDFLHPHDIGEDVSRMMRAVLDYGGAPRFQQLAALVNSLVNNRPVAFDRIEDAGVDAGHIARYEGVRQRYNDVYSRLNEAAERLFWGPFEGVKETLSLLKTRYDLYVASGVEHGALLALLAKHTFDTGMFEGVYGAEAGASRDKAAILRMIRDRGYRDILFVGDSIKDQAYARAAGVRFFRVKDAGDFPRLLAALEKGMPDEPEPWPRTAEELAFIRDKTTHVLREYARGIRMTPAAISAWINS